MNVKRSDLCSGAGFSRQNLDYFLTGSFVTWRRFKISQSNEYACCMLVACMLYACCMHAVCMLYACCMLAACLLHACCMHAVCLLHACCMLVVCMLYACCMLVVCMLYACCMLVVCMLYACCMLVVCMLYACCMLVVCMLYACCMLAVCLLYALRTYWSLILQKFYPTTNFKGSALFIDITLRIAVISYQRFGTTHRFHFNSLEVQEECRFLLDFLTL
jgi:hypothetical protein